HYEARLHGLPPPTMLQCQYNILERSAEDGLLPSARRLGYTTSVWGALAGGWLTERAVRDGAPSTAPSRVRSRPGSFDASLEGNAARLDVVRRLHAVARAIDQPLERMAIAFALSHP